MSCKGLKEQLETVSEQKKALEVKRDLLEKEKQGLDELNAQLRSEVGSLRAKQEERDRRVNREPVAANGKNSEKLLHDELAREKEARQKIEKELQKAEQERQEALKKAQDAEAGKENILRNVESYAKANAFLKKVREGRDDEQIINRELWVCDPDAFLKNVKTVLDCNYGLQLKDILRLDDEDADTGYQLLKWAAIKEYQDVALFLIECGAPAKSKWLLQCNSLSMVKYFLEKGLADGNVVIKGAIVSFITQY